MHRTAIVLVAVCLFTIPILADIIASEYGLVGDCNGDYKIDVFDLQILGASWGRMIGEPAFDERADLNHDERVNVSDLQMMAANWGKTLPRPGSLQVFIDYPTEPALGAKWTVNGGPWYDSGDILIGLAPGSNYTVTFSGIPGYLPPPSVPSVTIASDQTRQIHAAYRDHEYAAIFLNPTATPGLSIEGAVTLAVPSGIAVNSSSTRAVRTFGWPDIQVPQIDVVGGWSSYYDHFVQIPQPVPDPLAFVPEIDVNILIQQGLVAEEVPYGGTSSTSTLQLGSYHYYPTGITMNSGSLTLTPGIYILEGVGLKVYRGTFTADGVMFYIRSGQAEMNGSASIQITPPRLGDFPAADVYYGISLWQARDNTAQCTLWGGTLNLLGTVYLPRAMLSARGSMILGNRVIADTAEFQVSGTITIDCRVPGWYPGESCYPPITAASGTATNPPSRHVVARPW